MPGGLVMLKEYSTAQAFDALLAIPPTIDHDTRARVGMAAKDAGITFDDYDAWQSTNPRYDAGEVRSMWHGFKDGPVKAGTLFSIAKQHGWKPKGNQDGVDFSALLKQPPKATTKPQEPPRKLAPGMGASEVWNRCQPADYSHPYILAKKAGGVPLGNLRQVPAGDSLRIMGESMAQALVVPMSNIAGELLSLQFITTGETAKRLKAAGKPAKVNLPGAAMGDGFYSVGELARGALMYITEGPGTAWSAWQSTGATAVATGGIGRFKAVAQALLEHDDTARLVLCPDKGQEETTLKLAAELGHGVRVACIPEGEPDNFDLNELMQRDGPDVVERLLEAATEPPKPEADIHPMARFIDAMGEVMPPNWLVPGFLAADGATVVAGTHGVGKSTALVPLCLTIAGIAGHPELMPRQWRHICFCTEDAGQITRIIAGIVGHGGLGINADTVRERFHLVEAKRLNPAFVAQVAPTYREMFTRTIDGVEVPPLTVFDTKSACFATEDENSNSESSQLMSTLKQNFEGMPVWLITHVAKASRNDTSGLTARGASALEADANCTAFLTAEGDKRYLVLGKRRFEPRWPELVFESHTATVPAKDAWGNVEMVSLRWATAAPPEMSRQDAQQEAREEAQREEANACRGEVLDVVSIAWAAGQPLNRNAIKAKVRRQATQVIGCIESLLSESWLIEITVPSKERTNNRRSAFLVALTAPEREEFLASGKLPPEKLEIPQSWRKPANPFVPAPESEMPAPDGKNDESSPEKA